uniref:Nitrobindin heme-binding domain n=1 Tax=Myoviridae sp. ct3Pt8 TaxID=2826608 RepID=A0A8S5MMD5_9CAUD|nr:MAG TPA: nitrobindin heme-binding domain [Myoviridae sp. ct3Pt8]
MRQGALYFLEALLGAGYPFIWALGRWHSEGVTVTLF